MAPLLALVCTLALAANRPLAPAPDVRVSLLADVTHVAPGAEFHVVVRLTIPAGWHVYGENPGETGLATTAELTAPDGFRVGAPRYPAATRHVEAGFTSYVHEGELALFFPVRAPDELEVGASFEFAASASWLACRKSCVPGRGRAALALSAGAEAPRAAHSAELARHRARLPRPWEELVGASVRWSADVATVAVPGAAELDFLPGPPKDWGAKRIEVRRGEDAPVVDVELERLRAESTAARTLTGVLRVVDAEGREAFFEVNAAAR